MSAAPRVCPLSISYHLTIPRVIKNIYQSETRHFPSFFIEHNLLTGGFSLTLFIILCRPADEIPLFAAFIGNQVLHPGIREQKNLFIA